MSDKGGRLSYPPPQENSMKDFNDYKRKFSFLAISQGKDISYIERCLSYAENLNKKNYPIIYDLEHLSLLVGYKSDYIRRAISYPLFFYWNFYINKKNGKKRKISEPLPNLKDIQIWILNNILEKVPISPYAKAYVKNKKLKDNVIFHRGQKKVLALDLKDFFGSITLENVYSIFKEIGYTNQVSSLLAKLCCCNKKVTNRAEKEVLPQGAPTSPAISNIFMRDFDEAISSYCKEEKIRYTRYADDLTFSGDFDETILKNKVKLLLTQKNLILNEQKSKLMLQGSRQVVTGIIVNSKIQTPKKFRRNIRLSMYYIKKYGINRT